MFTQDENNVYLLNVTPLSVNGQALQSNFLLFSSFLGSRNQPNGFAGLDSDGNISNVSVAVRTNSYANLKSLTLENGELAKPTDRSDRIIVGDGVTVGGTDLISETPLSVTASGLVGLEKKFIFVGSGSEEVEAAKIFLTELGFGTNDFGAIDLDIDIIMSQDPNDRDLSYHQKVLLSLAPDILFDAQTAVRFWHVENFGTITVDFSTPERSFFIKIDPNDGGIGGSDPAVWFISITARTVRKV